MSDSDIRGEMAVLAFMRSKSRIYYSGVETRTPRRTVHRGDFTMSVALRNQRVIFWLGDMSRTAELM